MTTRVRSLPEEVQALYARYAALLDNGDYDSWVELFAEDCLYVVQPRENYEAGLPLATMRLESKGMLKDRIYGIRETLYHDPYYQRHLLSLPLIKDSQDLVEVEMNYLIIRTKPDQLSDILNAGRYVDTLAETPDGLLFTTKRCIFDTELIPNSLIYPI